MTDVKGWVPIALSANIEAGTSAGVMIGGAEIVVWRDSKGAAHVWEDRCPHRGMRMSFGFVRGDHIACLYHGWQYDTAGQCQHIPAHPDLEVPKTIKIPTYAVAERGGMIWTSLAEGADTSALPAIEGDVTPVRSLYADCSMAAVRALLPDVALPATDATTVTEITDACWMLTAGEIRVVIAGQMAGPEKSALHIVLLGATAAQRAPIAKWAETLRLSLEAEPAGSAMAEVA